MGKWSYSKKHRLSKSKNYTLILRQGKRVSQKNVIGYWLKNELDYQRLGIITSRKLGKANKRNYFKRIIRESFRTNPKRFKSGIDLIILGRNLKEIKFEEIKKEIDFIMQKAIEG